MGEAYAAWEPQTADEEGALKDCIALLTTARNLKVTDCFWNFAFNVFGLLLAADNRTVEAALWIREDGITDPPSVPVPAQGRPPRDALPGTPARQGELYFLVH